MNVSSALSTLKIVKCVPGLSEHPFLCHCIFKIQIFFFFVLPKIIIALVGSLWLMSSITLKICKKPESFLELQIGAKHTESLGPFTPITEKKKKEIVSQVTFFFLPESR